MLKFTSFHYLADLANIFIYISFDGVKNLMQFYALKYTLRTFIYCTYIYAYT